MRVLVKGEDHFSVGGKGAYIGSSNRDDSSLIASLYDRRIDASDGVGQGMEIGGQKLMQRKMLPQDIKKLHQSRGNKLRHGQIPCKR